MAINVKHINSDACFLLTFEPVIPEYVGDAVCPEPFTILLDPWITGPSKIFHSKISISTHKHPACISSLAELPSPPDLVIISQHKSDHCNEATLRQLPPTGTKTLILAEPASARLIKSWKYFDREKIQTIERWEDPRVTGKQSVVRVPVPPVVPGGQEGEVTVAFIPQKRDLAGLHSAIGITYRPPPTHHLDNPASQIKLLTPPTTPESQTFAHAGIHTPISSPTTDSFLAPPSPPISPHSLRSVRSASTLMASPTRPSRPTSSTAFRPVTASSSGSPVLAKHSSGRPVSVIFSPHGISYTYLESYITSHLVTEAALPLTALLHCMDRVENPWWLGGNVCAGVPTGAEIATKLGARIWVSAHDGEKDVRGLATGMLKTRRWGRDEVEGALDHTHHHSRKGADPCTATIRQAKRAGTEVMRLGSGDEVLVSGQGIWSSADGDKWTPPAPPRPKPRTPDELFLLPKMPASKAPRNIGIYKALRTKDLLRPSPRLELEPPARSLSTAANARRGPEAEAYTLPRILGSKKSFQRLGIVPRSLRKSSSVNQMGRYEMATVA
ncbi:hypothetical protein F4810DRAFT_570425 [Camillea tinctor]|nr:hypothetical protein F4810DRAFT_570425 [Camillea tinctor]